MSRHDDRGDFFSFFLLRLPLSEVIEGRKSADHWFFCLGDGQILRSMLYRGSEIIREVSWVVYDEIHYMRDKGSFSISRHLSREDGP